MIDGASGDMNAWVRAQPKGAISVIRTMLVKVRRYRYPRWWLAARSEYSRRRLLRGWLANVPGVDPCGLDQAVEAYLSVSRTRQLDHGDPLDQAFSLRLVQLVDLASAPDQPGGTYRDWLRDRCAELKSRRRPTARLMRVI